MSCQLCETRKARRYCPAVRGDICSICCGTEREQTLECPLECEYLQEARYREPLPDVDPNTFPNKEIEVSEKFLREKEGVLLFVSGSMLQSALEIPGVNDNDIKECLEALIRTYKTLETGLYYDSRPNNAIAGALFQRIQAGVQQYRQDMAQRTGMQTIRDADVLGVLVFLQRLEIQHNNGRRRGKAFIDFLRHYFAEFQQAHSQGELPEPPGAGSSLIVP